MASNKGFGNLAIKYGRSDKSVTNGPYEGNSDARLRTNGTAKSPSSTGLTMHGHIRDTSHALTNAGGKNPTGTHKAAKPV